MRKYKIVPAIVFILSVANLILGAVKGPNYYGLRSMGMGNTTVAVTTDRTAIFHNPAGLGLLKDKLQVSISPLIFAIDGKFFKIVNAMVEQGDKLTDISKIDADFIEMLNDLDGEWVGLEWIPEITAATNNLGFGVYTVFPVGVRIESGHLIPKLGLRGQRDLVFTWAVGVPLKTEKTHMGISVEYLQRTPLEETITTYSETFNYFDDMSSVSALGIIGDKADIQHGVSFDIGMMHDLKGFRLAYDIKDILGVIGGEIVAPPRFDIGCAYYFPWMESVKYIDNLIIAIEFSDLFGIEPVTEKYEHPAKKLHLGAELDMHYVAIRLGLNQGYATAGLGIRLGMFMMDYVFFTEELGYYPGQLGKRQHVLSMGIGFETDRPKRKKKEKDADDYDESMYEDTPAKKAPVSTPPPEETLPPAIEETPLETAPAQETTVPATAPVETPPAIEEQETTEQSEEAVEQGTEDAPEATDEDSEETEETTDEADETTDESSSEEDIGWE